jgi:2-polyprenyl-6-methoxyphenol hydroxylase-like FAD-dependent oxidoreductase
VLNAKVLISGASIAGPSLALWLARYGADVTVVESAPALRTGGQLVDVRGTARGVLERSGLDDAIRAARTGADGLSFVDSHGRRQASVAAADFGGDGPICEIEILRGTLSRIFYDATREVAEFAYDYRDLDALKAVVRSRAAGMGWQADTLIGQLDQAPDFYFDSCSQVLLPRWSSGRVRLVGDAAYCASPLSGHGTTMALVGAYILAGELARAEGDLTAGLRAYDDRLRPWITEIQRSAPDNGKTMTPNTALGIEFRRRLVQLQEHQPVKSLVRRARVQLSSAFTLPDYTRFEANRLR